jgi:phosphopantothenoylcysteine decarboxylase/phosphopantothenate--cysteine ligase
MAAAPADFRPVSQSDAKIKKSHDGAAPVIELIENPDILAELVATRTSKRPVIVGFAAETGDANGSVMDHARTKLERKGCDLLVVNDVSEGRVFNAEDNEAVILGADGTVREVPTGPKVALAHAVWDVVANLLPSI